MAIRQGILIRMVVGVDEAGRGCWAGPLVAAAVLLGEPINGLADSKRLSAARRLRLAIEIKRRAAAFGLGWVSPAEIDAIGLTAATTKAMNQACSSITLDYKEIVIDGSYNYLPAYSCVRTLVRADGLIPSVSAASILAKVARDDYMRRIAGNYPLYEFQKHVGYGTALHHRLLRTYGPCELHRLSYKPLKALLNNARI